MKYPIVLITFLFSIVSCGQNQSDSSTMQTKKFKSEKITKSATITLNGNIETVFPLFNPIEEQKWAPPFKPQFIYPSDETVQEGMSFKTIKADRAEPEYLWILTRYDTSRYQLQYLLTTANRYWTIDVACTVISNNRTSASIRYSYYALNKQGIELNKTHLNRIFGMNLKDWEDAINSYLNKK